MIPELSGSNRVVGAKQVRRALKDGRAARLYMVLRHRRRGCGGGFAAVGAACGRPWAYNARPYGQETDLCVGADIIRPWEKDPKGTGGHRPPLQNPGPKTWILTKEG